ncbi:MAG: condensation domain-containing protein, partial [Legionella sp.]
DFVKIETRNNRKELFFCSRSQRLIKRYGQLINLDQIEYVLKHYDTTREFIAFSDEENEHKIYLIIRQPHEDDALLNQIKAHLKAHLPSYMHPNEYLFTKEIPITASGKINYYLIKKALAHQHTDNLSDYFKRFFRDKPFNINAKIVDLGLESIDYIEMAEEFLRITGKWLNVAKINEDTRISTIDSCLVALNPQKSELRHLISLNPLQRDFYSLELNKITDRSSCIIAYYCLQGKIDTKRLEAAISSTLNNHFILNSKLDWTDNGYVFVQGNRQSNFRLRSPIFFQKNEIKKLIISVHSQRLVNIYIQKKRNHYFLIMTYHHIAIDAWSAILVREEIFQRYEGTYKIMKLNQDDEINHLNKVNELSEQYHSNIGELRSLLSDIDPYQYNQLSALFKGVLHKQNTCFSIEKNKMEQFTHDHQLHDYPYGVIFILLLHRIISQLSQANKLCFYISLSNRNLPIPHAKKLITNLATGLPCFLDNTDLTAKEFASKIKNNLTVYFRNMGYSNLNEIWEDDILREKFSLRNELQYRIIVTYVNKIRGEEFIQKKYIDWNRSTHITLPEKKRNTQRSKGLIFLRIYNMGSHFWLTLSSTSKENIHETLINALQNPKDIIL